MKISEDKIGKINKLRFYIHYLKNMDAQHKNDVTLYIGQPPKHNPKAAKQPLNPLLVDVSKRASKQQPSGNKYAEKCLEDAIKLMKLLYDKTQNPLFALRALKICMDGHFDIPEWIADYTTKSVTNLLNFAADAEPGRPDDRLSQSLGFRTGKSNYFKEFQRTINQARDVFLMMDYRLKTNLSWEQAYAQTADRAWFSGDPLSPIIAEETAKRWRLALFKIL